METLCSIGRENADDSAVVFDFVVARSCVGWYRHDFDEHGRYAAVQPCTIGELRAEAASEAPALFVLELRAAADTLGRAADGLVQAADNAAAEDELEVAGLLVRRASEVREHRLDALDTVMDVCEEAWDEAIDRVASAGGDDPEALPQALRTVELLWTARAAVRRLIRAG
jgi:hypothetical protein